MIEEGQWMKNTNQRTPQHNYTVILPVNGAILPESGLQAVNRRRPVVADGTDYSEHLLPAETMNNIPNAFVFDPWRKLLPDAWSLEAYENEYHESPTHFGSYIPPPEYPPYYKYHR